jgi:hypothetical protein
VRARAQEVARSKFPNVQEYTFFGILGKAKRKTEQAFFGVARRTPAGPVLRFHPGDLDEFGDKIPN